MTDSKHQAGQNRSDSEPTQHLFGQRFNIAENFLDWFKERYGDSLLAVIFYGSCLNPETISATSSPDFYLIISRYRDIHKNILHRLLNAFLPPNIYFLTLQGAFCKYNTISHKDYLRATSGNSKDIYNLGRLSKRFAVLHYRDDSVKNMLGQSYLATCDKVIRMSVPLLPDQFSLDQLIKKALSLSYIGETRVEAGDKVERLFLAEREFYRRIYAERLQKIGPDIRCSYDSQTQHCTYQGRPLAKRWQARQVGFFLWQSKIRTILRWPKYAFTSENWVDYILAKIERATGQKIELTPRERRYPLIFGWKHFWRLKRKGFLK